MVHMKKYTKLLLALSFTITFSWTASAQLLDPCASVPLDQYQQCLEGGGGGGINPQVPNQPPVVYALGTTGEVFIATNENIFEGIPSKIHLVKNGSNQPEVFKTFPLGTRITDLKVSGENIVYILRYGTNDISTSVKVLTKDTLGHFVETSLFEELTESTQGQYVYSYQYANLSISDDYAYVRKTTFKHVQQEQVCVPGLGCLENNEPLTYVGADVNYYRQRLSAPDFEVVNSIPGAFQESRYTFSVFQDDIYRTDSVTGQTIRWLVNNDEAGHNLQIVGVSEGYLLFKSTSGLNDITTNLIAVKITDEVPQPKLRLTTDMTGIVFVAYQVETEISEIKIKVGQTNIENLNDGFGPLIILGRKTAVQIEGAKIGDEVKIHLKRGQMNSTLIASKTISENDVTIRGIPFIIFNLPSNTQ